MNEENTNLKHIIENMYLREEKKRKGDIPHDLWLSDFPIAHFSI